jgi:hypothetical protein
MPRLSGVYKQRLFIHTIIRLLAASTFEGSYRLI